MPSSNNGWLPRYFSGGLLRRLRPGDLASFQFYRSNPELGRYQGWAITSEAEALAFLTRMNTAPMFPLGDWVQLGIAEPVADRLIGDIGIFLAADGKTAQIGYTLEFESQGRGIATAAVREAMHLLFAATRVRQVLGITDERNKASCRLLERAGFQHRENREAVFRGESCTEKIYVRLRNDR